MSEELDVALRADIPRLGNLLGQTLVRQEGPDLLTLVGQGRALSRSDGAAAAELLAGVDAPTGDPIFTASSVMSFISAFSASALRPSTIWTRISGITSWRGRA